MAIDLTEKLIPLGKVPAQTFLPRRRGGKKLNVATVYRWATSGVQGVRLETVGVGGTLCTSRSALLEFFQRLAPRCSDSTVAPTRTPNQRQRAADKAAKQLEAAGI
jgi:hypothetical protein